MFAVIMMCYSSASFRLDKPGMKKLDKYLKGLPILFLSNALQVTAKIYALTRLMLIEDISGMAKYSTLVAVNIVVLTSLNYLTDSSHLQKPRNLSAGDLVKNFVSKV